MSIEAQIERELAAEQSALGHDKSDFTAVNRATSFFLRDLRIDTDSAQFFLPSSGERVGELIKALHVCVDGEWHALIGPALEETLRLLQTIARAAENHRIESVRLVQNFSIEIRVHRFSQWSDGPKTRSLGTWHLSREAADLKQWIKAVLVKALDNWDEYREFDF